MSKICIIIPCYKVKNKIAQVVSRLLKKKISKIIVIDDNCPEKTGKYVLKKFKQVKIKVIFLKKNMGVGGASIEGFKYAIKNNYSAVIKVDGDNQHNLSDLNKIINVLKGENYDVCKGYRFDNIVDYFNIKMPFIRIFGATSLTIILRLVSGNWIIKDVCHGMVGFRIEFLKKLNLRRVQKNFFFEQDMLFHSILKKARIMQIKSLVKYDHSFESNLKPLRSIIPFLFYHFRNFIFRLKSRN